MRRCDRHPSRENDPYKEFNFEKSLRKYEPCPHKKIKKDTNSISKTIHSQHWSLHLNHPTINISQGKQVLKDLTQKENTQMLAVSEQALQSNAKKQHDQALILKVQGSEISLKEEKVEQKSPNLSFLQVVNIKIQNQDFEVDQALKKSFKIISQSPKNNEQAVISSRQVINTQQIVQSKSQQLLSLLMSSPKEQVSSCSKKEEKKARNYLQKQGRLYLTENISVSLRSINKLKQSGIKNKDIIENLLKRMKFTSEQKIQVSSKLDEIFEVNQ